MKIRSTFNNKRETLKTKHTDQKQISRRQFLSNMGLATAATLLMQIPGALKPGWIKSAHAATIDVYNWGQSKNSEVNCFYSDPNFLLTKSII